MSRNCFEKKKDDFNFNIENSESRSNSNQNSNSNKNFNSNSSNSNQNRRSNSNSMFVEYVDNSIEITHNQLSTQISDIAWIVDSETDDHCSENRSLFMNESKSFNEMIIIVSEERIAVIDRDDI